MSNLNSQTLKLYLANNLLSKKITMKFIPILFSTPMVQAILDGSKTQTRRPIKGLEKLNDPFFQSLVQHATGKITFASLTSNQIVEPKCPYGKTGDILWVREKSCYVHLEHAHDLLEGFRKKRQIIYGTDMHDDWMKYAKEKYGYKWTPSLFMPKEACRIFLKITNVRVERLHDISEEDAKEEGIIDRGPLGFTSFGIDQSETAKEAFKYLWEKINGKESLESNPFVWVIEFERCVTPLNFLSNGI